MAKSHDCTFRLSRGTISAERGCRTLMKATLWALYFINNTKLLAGADGFIYLSVQIRLCHQISTSVSPASINCASLFISLACVGPQKATPPRVSVTKMLAAPWWSATALHRLYGRTDNQVLTQVQTFSLSERERSHGQMFDNIWLVFQTQQASNHRIIGKQAVFTSH